MNVEMLYTLSYDSAINIGGEFESIVVEVKVESNHRNLIDGEVYHVPSTT